MTKKVVVPATISKSGLNLLQNQGFQIATIADASVETLLKAGKDADGIIIYDNHIGEAVLSQMPNLKIIARHGVGYDNVDLAASAKHHVWVTNTPNANADTVAETTLAEIFDLSKNLTKISMEMRQGNYHYGATHRGFDLAGKTLGIVGYGRIGQAVAKKASALDMQIIIYDRSQKESPYGRFVSLPDLLQTADVVTLHLAANNETRHVIGAEQLTMMKPTSVLVNLGRGSLIDIPALVNALKAHRLSAAALDVFETEPLPDDSELYQLENVLLTPHIGSSTTESYSRMAVDSASEVIRVLNGQRPQWPVNQLD